MKYPNRTTFIFAVVVFFFMRNTFLRFAYSDFGPFSSNWGNDITKFIYRWSQESFGMFRNADAFVLIKVFFEALSLNHIILSQSLFIFFVLLFCCFSFYFLLYRMKTPAVVALMMPILFTFNSVTSSDLTNGTINLLIPYGMMPLAYYFFWKLLDKFNVKDGIIFSLIISLTLINVQVAFWMFLGIIPLFAVNMIFRRFNMNNLKIVGCFFIGLFINIFCLFSFFSYSSNFKNISYLNDFNYTYSSAKFLNLFRIIGNQGSSQPFFGYFDINIINMLYYLIFIVIVTFFFFKKNAIRGKIIFYSSFFTLLILMGILVLIEGGFFDYLILSNNLILVSARNPQKIFYLFSFCFYLLLSIALTRWFNYFKDKGLKLVFYFLIFVIIIVHFSFNKQFFSGDFGLHQLRKDNYYIEDSKLKLFDKLLNLKKESKVLYLPLDYSTQMKLSQEQRIIKPVMGGKMLGASEIDQPLNDLYDSICSGKLDEKYLKRLSVDYIVLDKKVSYIDNEDNIAIKNCSKEFTYETPYIRGSFDFFDGVLEKFETYYEDDNFKIIKIQNENNIIYGSVYYVSIDNFHTYKGGKSCVNSEVDCNYIGGNVLSAPDSVFVLQHLFSNIRLSSMNLLNNIETIKKSEDRKLTLFDEVSSSGEKQLQLYVNGEHGGQYGSLVLNGISASSGPISLKDGVNKFEYVNPAFAFNNVIENPSFEYGEWQEKVGDCNNNDKNPILAMNLNTQEKSDGNKSLQLEAKRHIACTSQKIEVNSGSSYLLSFDYQSPNATDASYYIGFNDKEKHVISESLPFKDKNWHTFSKTIKIPEGATSVSLYVYAKSTDEKMNIINRYDNFKLIEVPDLSDAYYLVSESDVELRQPSSITFDLINPTKKLVHIKSATTPFYLAMNESYHPQWQAQMNNGKINGFFASWVPFVRPDRIADEFHYKLNDFLNGWYVDTVQLCESKVKSGKLNGGCIKNDDGSYDIEMTLEFFPQRWFYLGLLVSGTTLTGCFGYLGWYYINQRRKRD